MNILKIDKHLMKVLESYNTIKCVYLPGTPRQNLDLG